MSAKEKQEVFYLRKMRSHMIRIDINKIVTPRAKADNEVMAEQL